MTIGHSTHTPDEFVALLEAYHIEAIADVRRFPSSRRYPHFGSDALAASMPANGIDYHWMPKLGGRRKALVDSPNTAWRNVSFRGYADHLASAEFAEGLAELLTIASAKRTALMCAEAVWWRCHRSLISDVLKLRDVDVVHIMDATHSIVHPYTSPARIVDGRLDYSMEHQPSTSPLA